MVYLYKSYRERESEPFKLRADENCVVDWFDSFPFHFSQNRDLLSGIVEAAKTNYNERAEEVSWEEGELCVIVRLVNIFFPVILRLVDFFLIFFLLN